MKETGIVRKVDELGRIVLPIELRKAFGIEEKDSLAIYTDTENGFISFKKVSSACSKCGDTENLTQIKPGFFLCKKCLQVLAAE